MKSASKNIIACILIALLALGIASIFPDSDSMFNISRAFGRSATALKSYTGKLPPLQATSSYSMSSDNSQPNLRPNADGTETQTQGKTLGLPGPGEGEKTILDVGTGQSVSLDHLGPMVVNTDGSLSRISNWAEMSEIEQKSTMRIIGKRNKQRLAALKDKEGEA